MVSRTENAQHLYDWCILVLEVMDGMIPDSQTDWGSEVTKRNLSDALRRQDVRVLKMGYGTFLDWVTSCGPEVRGTVDRALRAKFGEGLPTAYRMQTAEVRAILKRGRVRSDDEFRELEAWVDRAHGTATQVARARRVKEMLASYVQTRSTKMGGD